MALISLNRVSHHFGGPLILSDVSLDVERGQKIGVIGQNGAGKSTILRLIAEEYEPAHGEVVLRRGLRVAHQAQELIRDEHVTVRDEMREIFRDALRREERLRDLERTLAEPGRSDHEELLAEYERLTELHQLSGGFDVERRIDSVLTGLGLPESAWDQPINRFSGGEKNIIGLARILLIDPELILLDEPSNHLDMDGLEWFIRWLRGSRATVVMVSHNRHLLDLCVDTIWEVKKGKVAAWTGNYTDFQEQKADALDLQERQFKNQQRLIKRIEFQARRLKDMAKAYDDPGQAKRAKAMERRLEQMEKIERPDTSEKRFHASIQAATRHGQIALSVKDWSFAFDDRVLFDHANLELTFGQRACLVGPNGSGKTTFFREVQEHGSFHHPVLRLGAGVKLGDYNQIHQEVFDPGATLIDWLMDRTGMLLTPAANLLHRFLFTREDLDRPIDTLSGGEKSRLQLARLVHEQVNFLMLDEPTNHLDLEACEELERMLEDYEGTLLIISHDQVFLEKLVDVVVEVKDRQLVRHMGTFSEWWEARQALAQKKGGSTLSLNSRKQEAEQKSVSQTKVDREERKAEERDRRQQQREVQRLEKAIATLETEERDLVLALEVAYSQGGDAKKGPALAARLDACRKELESAMTTWTELASRLE
jgi:ATP-binding cassette subfamily F protein 3